MRYSTWELLTQIREVVDDSQVLDDILQMLSFDTVEMLIQALITDYDLDEYLSNH